MCFFMSEVYNFLPVRDAGQAYLEIASNVPLSTSLVVEVWTA